jgi:hypothetical protein
MFLVTDLDSKRDIFHGGYHGDLVVLVSCFAQVIRDKYERQLDSEGVSDQEEASNSFVTLCRMQRGMQQTEVCSEDSLR